MEVSHLCPETGPSALRSWVFCGSLHPVTFNSKRWGLFITFRIFLEMPVQEWPPHLSKAGNQPV